MVAAASGAVPIRPRCPGGALGARSPGLAAGPFPALGVRVAGVPGAPPAEVETLRCAGVQRFVVRCPGAADSPSALLPVPTQL